MAHLLAIFLIMLQVFAFLTMANETADSPGQPNVSPVSSPRKLGKHRHKLVRLSTEAPHLTPSESPRAKEDELSPLGHQDAESGLMQEIHVKKHHRDSVDKSIAGGGVILGGLVATFLFAIFRYIRATRRNSATSPPNSP